MRVKGAHTIIYSQGSPTIVLSGVGGSFGIVMAVHGKSPRITFDVDGVDFVDETGVLASVHDDEGSNEGQ